MTQRAAPPSRTQRATRLWTDGIWPPLAGAVVATGIIGASARYEWAGIIVFVAGVGAIAAVLVHSLSPEAEMSVARSLQVGSVVGGAVLVLTGLLALFPVIGWGIGAVAVLPSPPVTDWTARAVRRRIPGAGRPLGTRRARDQARVDRAFGQIVAELHLDS